MEIEYLCDRPEYVDLVAGWVYNEFVIGTASSFTLEGCKDYFSKTNKTKLEITFVAIIDYKGVGTVSIFENDLDNQKVLTPWLASLYVEPDYRSKGIAKQLIEKVKQAVKGLGYEKLYLRTEHTSEYYKALGWVHLYDTKDEKGIDIQVFKIDL